MLAKQFLSCEGRFLSCEGSVRHIAGCALQIITSSLCAAQIMSDASPGHGGCATNKGSTVQEMEIQATSLAAVRQVQLMTITLFFTNL